MPVVNINWKHSASTEEQKNEIAAKLAAGISEKAHVEPQRIIVSYFDVYQPADTGPIIFINWSAVHTDEEKDGVAQVVFDAFTSVMGRPYPCVTIFYDIPLGNLGGGGKIINRSAPKE